ncbi:MAG: sodium:alanine symporter family protein [Bacteroidales bacterium]|nr:sodium:alanine symporter family protein [Candidatus Cacconaster scatequi]
MWEKICRITEFLWGVPLIVLMIGVGLYLTIGTGLFQITGIGRWWKKTVGEIFGKTSKPGSGGKGELTPFQTISTVLAGTVGSGNIADMAVGFIVIPNMIALLALSPKFFKLLREYNLRY